MATLQDYSSKDFSISWLGIDFTSGLAADSFITITPNSARTETETGAGNNHSTSKLADNSGIVTVSLQQQSEINCALIKLQREEDLENTIYRGDMQLRTQGGVVVYQLVDCHMQSRPEAAYGMSASGSTRDWEFYCAELVPVVDLNELGFSVTLQAQIDDLVALAKATGTITL